MKKIETKITLVIILINLLLGNRFLYFGGHSSFSGDINYALMAGMSITTIVIYYLFFKFSDFQNYGHLKLLLACILNCMIIIFVGNSIAVLIVDEAIGFSKIPKLILMGIMGNIVMFWVSLIFGILNFVIITSLKKSVETNYTLTNKNKKTNE